MSTTTYDLPDGFEGIVAFEPGYNCTDNPCGRNGCGTNPGSSHGKHGMGIRFVLRNTETGNATQFLLWTDWVPGESRAASRPAADMFPMAVDLGYHRTVPADYKPDEDSWEYVSSCEYSPTGRCSYDGSGLAAEPVLKDFIEKGEAGVWPTLLDYYNRTFKETT